MTRSLGHLQRTSRAVTARHASAMAAPAASASTGTSAASTDGRRRTDIASDVSGGATHDRPRRPRPDVCSPAATTVHSGAPAAARPTRSVFVDPVLRTNRVGTSMPASRTAASSEAASSTGPTRSDVRAGALGGPESRGHPLEELATDRPLGPEEAKERRAGEAEHQDVGLGHDGRRPRTPIQDGDLPEEVTRCERAHLPQVPADRRAAGEDEVEVGGDRALLDHHATGRELQLSAGLDDPPYLAPGQVL